jgi:hypothetical protein
MIQSSKSILLYALIRTTGDVFEIKMSRESRVEEAVLPDLSSLTKEEQRAVRGMVLLHTMNPSVEDEDKTVKLVTRMVSTPKIELKDGWPKARRAKKS